MRLAMTLRFDEFVSDPSTPEVLVQRLAQGETLEEICSSRMVPYAVVASWIARNADLADACAAATRLWADKLVKEGTSAVDAATKPEDVPVAKLKSDWRKWLAGQVNRDRYGKSETTNVNLGVKVEIVRFSDGAPVEGMGLRVERELNPALTASAAKNENNEAGDALDASPA